MSEPLLIWGTGGHARVVLDVALATSLFTRIMFIDDEPAKDNHLFCGRAVIAGPEQLHSFFGAAVVIAIGNNKARARCFTRAIERGLLPATLVHPAAVISPSAIIGSGSVVMPGAIINACARIGDNCIVNTGAIVEHHCSIGNHVHASPRAVLGGNVEVGDFAHVGIGAVILPRAFIGPEAVVGAGAVVLKEVPANSTVAGVPAHILRLS